MRCFSVVMFLVVKNYQGDLRQIVYQAVRNIFPAADKISFFVLIDDHKTLVINCCCHGKD